MPSKGSSRLFIFLAGLCMGCADLVPGVSGGTMAFILGIYEELIAAIRSFRFRSLVALQFAQFFKQIHFQFLACLLAGIAASFIAFSHIVSNLLQKPNQRTILYAAFFGLILSSAFLLARKIKGWRLQDYAALVFGGFLAYFLTDPTWQNGVANTLSSTGWINPWLILCGAIAISAMLLPGISGSYLLVILGVYPIALEALTEFLTGLKSFQIEKDSFLILANFLIGIITGALIFSRIINWFLKKFPQTTFALLTGFMIGALKTVWPYWSYTYVLHPFKPEKGDVLSLLKPILPNFHTSLFWESIFSALSGFAIVLLMEYAAKKKLSKNLGKLTD